MEISKNMAPLNTMANIPASNKLMSGPPSADHIIPFLGFLKFMGLIGTGFAHPKTTGDFIKISITGTIIVPNGSI